MEIKTIAHIHTDFAEKFGLPRQSGLIEDLKGYIVFEKEYRDPEAIRGIEGYDYLWLLWGFEVKEDDLFRPTVRPPRLGGNERMGVFATRSPFRPNHIGLSSVRLESVEMTKGSGPILYVSGIDMKDNTPIYDIKPYLAYTDSHDKARSGFTDTTAFNALEVDFADDLLFKLPEEKRAGAIAVLKGDIRPSYHRNKEEEAEYGLSYAGFNIRFKVKGSRLSVYEVSKE
ncbi:MAG: tRNA (N6-threonylcarbamoyladenosine(37)-N6)-methyltransferase TrmO [Lachnospiraceae bacterium]|nr:tRNA (N6-threonylcarbamoyladenosine(37)-N6)-methyltransferase TrmO [Lachnospiraceae bacterium]